MSGRATPSNAQNLEPNPASARREEKLVRLYGPEIVEPATRPQAGRKVQGFSLDAVADTLAIVDGDDPRRREKVEPWVKRLSWALDEMVRVPGINRRFGLDGLLGLIPGVGEGAGAAAAFTVVVSAIASGVSIPTILRMLLNIGVDSLFGSIPFLGQAWDFYFKSNTRNLGLIEADLADREATRRSSTKVLLLAGVALIFVVLLLAIVLAINIYVIAWAIKNVFDK